MVTVLAHSAGGTRRKALFSFAGIGFAKNMDGNLEIMSGLQRIRSQLKGAIQGMPMLIGPSRKGFLGKLTGSLAACTYSLLDCYASLFLQCQSMLPNVLNPSTTDAVLGMLEQQPTGLLFNAIKQLQFEQCLTAQGSPCM